jgi:hypothetical protein
MNNNSCSKWGNTMQDHMEHINREVANAASLSEIEKLLSCLQFLPPPVEIFDSCFVLFLIDTIHNGGTFLAKNGCFVT